MPEVQTAATRRALKRGSPALTDAELEELVRMEGYRKLWRGDHEAFFVDEGRTQHHFQYLTGEQRNLLYVTDNLARLLTLKFTDLLVGEEPLIEPAEENEVQAEALTRIAAQSRLHAKAYTAALGASIAGLSWLKVRLRGGKVILSAISAGYVFPEWEDRDDLLLRSVEQRSVHQVGETQYLWVERHLPGRIEHELWLLDEAGYLKGRMPDLTPIGRSEPPVQETRVDELLFVPVPNVCYEDEFASDYAGLESLFDNLNNRRSQISRVLDRHGDPKLQVPEEMFDADGNFRFVGYEALGLPPGATALSYLTWDAHLADQFQDVEETALTILRNAEMAPRLVGLKKGAGQEATETLRLEAITTLAKVNRKALFFRPALAAALRVAQKLENAWVPGRRYPVGDVDVTLRDGLPADEQRQTAIEADAVQARIRSRYRAILNLSGDAEEAEEELTRMAEEEAGEPGSLTHALSHPEVDLNE